jgi:hypothetical protein
LLAGEEDAMRINKQNNTRNKSLKRKRKAKAKI